MTYSFPDLRLRFRGGLYTYLLFWPNALYSI